jgi:hypothetical protein
MTREQFNKAMEIILEHHSSEIIINKPQDDGFVDTKNIRLQIKNCVPSVLSKLINADFIVGVRNGIVEVSSF